jgi:ubiquitin-conjugating enzyme E2 Q
MSDQEPSIIRNVSVIENEANNSPSIIDDDHPVNVVNEDAVNVTNDAGLDTAENDASVVGSHREEEEEKDDDESDYSYTHDDDEEYSGFLIPTAPVRVEEDQVVPPVAASSPSSQPDSAVEERKLKKWVDPSREAVSMSLRAEREKTGGRRRLASDLYKIMSSSTEAAGFTLSPACEDSMEKWCIKLFDFDTDSNLAKDLVVVGLDCVELEMSFPEQYPFEPPFVRVVTPKFQRQTGFVMNGALCMELLTKDGWNPINDIESVIVSIRSLMVVGDGRVKAAVEMGEKAYEEALKLGLERRKAEREEDRGKRKRDEDNEESGEAGKKKGERKTNVGSYSAAEASMAYEHLSKFHEEKGWDKSGWWTKRG